MKRTTQISLVAGVLVTLLGAPAQADTPGFVTRSEFNQVERDMSRLAVQAIYDVKGERVSAWVGTGGHFHVEKAYPKANGDTTTVIYRDSAPGNNHVRRLYVKNDESKKW